VTPEQLVCNIIQVGLGLSPNNIWQWDQKISEPTNGGMYVVVQVSSCKPFGNSTRFVGSDEGMTQVQSVNMCSTLSIDIMSRSREARDRKEEVVMALKSMYAEQQQEQYSFQLSTIPSGFMNLSKQDGAGMLYRFNISVRIQYFKTKTTPVAYYDTFGSAPVVVNG
jgi:hypothetical protein